MLELNFQPFPELTTERLLLRRMTMDDAEEVFFLRSDDAPMQYIQREKATSIKQAEEYIALIEKNVTDNVAIMWAMALKENPSKLIGNICLFHIRKENFRAELGYVLHPDHWKKGLTREGVLKVVDYGFSVMKLHSIDAVVDPRNMASLALLESIGFVREAYFKEDSFFNGKFLDTAVYSLLKKSFHP